MRVLSLLTIVFSLVGCQVTTSGPEGEVVAIPPGKADNYLSPVVQEYDVEGQVLVKLSDDVPLEERDKQAAKLATQMMDRLTRGLSSKLKELSPEDQHGKDAVIVYLRRASVTTDQLTAQEGGGYSFLYKAEVAGTSNLLPFSDGTRAQVLELGEGEERQSVTLQFAPSVAVKDTYPRYRELFKDGLEIYIHYGGDYNDSRWDIKKSTAMFDKLKAMGLTPPTESYDEFKLDSGPFVGQLDAGGEQVQVRVTMVHPEMVGDDELQQLVDAYKQHARAADVVIYAGHASEDTGYSGVVVHYNPRKALPASEFKSLDLPDRYQIFVFSGCYTYTGYADQLLQNPKKSTDNVDVVTAVSSTPLSRDIVSALLGGLVDQSADTWYPRTWREVLQRVNDESERAWRGGFGVHGLESNPTSSGPSQKFLPSWVWIEVKAEVFVEVSDDLGERADER